MVKSQHVIYLSLIVIVGLLASLVTMVAMNNNPMGNLEPAQAQGAGSMSDVLAVPVNVGSDQQFLAVISRPDRAPRVGERGSTSGELALAVYDMEFGGQDARLRWMGTRRIEFDLKVPQHGLHRDQQPRRSGDDLSPAGVEQLVERWVEEREDNRRRNR